MTDFAAYQHIVSRFSGVRPGPKPGYLAALCPAHDDRRPSLSIWIGDNGCLLARCYANHGCTFEAICRAVGTEPTDWFPDRERLYMGGSRIVATYDYRDAAGQLAYQAVRFDPKSFRQRRPAGKPDEWIWNLEGVDPLPYRLPDLLARPNQPVVIVEGEKDADALWSLGLCATCNSGGAGKWPRSAGAWLEGRRVAIIPDLDEPGWRHAYDVAAKLMALPGAIEALRIVRLPQPVPGIKDVSDWLRHVRGDKRAELLRVLRAAAEWAPAAGEVLSMADGAGPAWPAVAGKVG